MDTPLTHANIITILGIERLPLDIRKAVVEEATDLVQTRVFGRIIETLSDEQKKEFISCIENDNVESALALISGQGIDVGKVTSEEIDRVKREIADIIKEH